MRKRWTLLVALHITSSAARVADTPRPTETRENRLGYFCRIGVAGATACSVTHSVVVPLDVIKTRMQTDVSIRGPVAAANAVLRASPRRGILRCSAFFNGIAPTAMGYWLQGATKFGGYEAFKQHAFHWIRETKGDETVRKWCLPVMLVSAATAEMAATALLAPLEVLKLRVQTDSVAASRGLFKTFMHIMQHEGPGALYVGLMPIAMRQLPYTVTKLVAYELVSKAVTRTASQLEQVFWPDSNGEAFQPYAIIFAGLVAGAAAAIISHPADLLLTRICGSATTSVATNVAECVIAEGFVEQARYLMSLGISGAFAGLGPRLVMTSAMTSLQFVLYENVRQALGVSATVPPPTAVVLPA